MRRHKVISDELRSCAWRLSAEVMSRALLTVILAALPAAASAQELMPSSPAGWTALAPRPVAQPARSSATGVSSYSLSISGNGIPNVYGGWTTRIQGIQAGAYYRFNARAVATDITSLRESITIVARWRGSFGDEVSPDYVWDYQRQPDGSLSFQRTLRAPAGATAVDIELILQWSANGRVSFDGLSFTATAAPAPRRVRVAAIYFRPSGTASGAESVRQAASYADQVASSSSPDVMVLGETLNVIGAPGTYDNKAETVPGPSTDVMANIARGHGVNIVFGILEKENNFLYNTAVFLDRNGNIKGKYRKVQLPLAEASGGVTPGDTVPVFDTDIGRVALLICQDTAFPEPAREAALQGAEMLLVPIWGGKTAAVRARALAHSVYVAASGYDYASEVISPLGIPLATVSTMSAPGVAIADIDLSQRFREDWLGDWRDISNKERRTAPYRFDPESPSPPPSTDTTPPTVVLTSPASGATVSGAVNIAADASDNVAVTKVAFLVDGVQTGSDDAAAPYAITWDSRAVANGNHTITATAYDAAGHTASSSVTINVSNGVSPPPPTAQPIPGTIQAEDYDAGGEGISYHDTTAGNSGGQYRTDDVDVEQTSDAGGGFDVGWLDRGEWLKYTVSGGTGGAYKLTARVAANGPGGTFHVEVGGANVTGPLSIPNTGGWQSWVDVVATVNLSAGTQPMRFVVDGPGSTGIVGNLNYLRFESASPAAPPEVVLYATDFARHGVWTTQSDSTAAGGQKMSTPDNGVANTAAPLANPADYVEATFTAPAATSYTVWLRLRALNDNKYNDAVWVQFSDARAAGSPAYPINSTSGLLVNLAADSAGTSLNGWGWQNGAYWLSQATTVTFATSGSHVVRIQVREDGAQIDQVVLSPSRYLSGAPGPGTNDNTIVPK